MKQLVGIRAIMVVLACSFALSVVGCKGGEGGEGTGGGVGGAGGSGGAGGAGETPIDVMATGRVGLGTIGGATIDVYAYDDLETPLVSVESSTGTLEETGHDRRRGGRYRRGRCHRRRQHCEHGHVSLCCYGGSTQ
ncbi:MAG: hypothetical protein JRJ24_12300 [Deltaproteobacteria bacterium]|nr:hypothetical protein [Deltaproteobacteria bacterium]